MPDKPEAAVTLPETQEDATPVLPPQRVGFLGRVAVFRNAMPELWVVFAVKLFAILAYKTLNITLVLWLSKDLGYSDVKASYWVFIWSTSITVITLLVGSLTDVMGLRRAFLLGVWICVIARLAMTFSSTHWIALGAGLLPLAFGEALGSPVMIAAVRRYSTTAQRSMAFSLSYVIMNAGFFISQVIFDELRKHLGEYGHYTVPLLGTTLTTYRTLFLVSFLFELVLLPLLYFGIREGAEATDSGVVITPREEKYGGLGMWQRITRALKDTLVDTARMWAELARQPGFYRLLGFLMFIASVKLIFMVMDYMYYKFGVRELGPGTPLGRLWGINSLLIIVLVPVVGVMSQKLSAYKAVIIGTALSALSVFWLAMPTAWFEPLANTAVTRWSAHVYLGLSGTVSPWYVMFFLFVVLCSIGEAFYSPRVYEYAAAIAPKGQEASYGALSYVPFFLAKLFVGLFGGQLLERYCPETGPRHSQTMWLFVALTATIAPVGLIVLRRYIRVHEAGRQD